MIVVGFGGYFGEGMGVVVIHQHMGFYEFLINMDYIV